MRPPVANTLPLASSAVVWNERGIVISPAVFHWPVAGLYISEVASVVTQPVGSGGGAGGPIHVTTADQHGAVPEKDGRLRRARQFHAGGDGPCAGRRVVDLGSLHPHGVINAALHQHLAIRQPGSGETDPGVVHTAGGSECAGSWAV